MHELAAAALILATHVISLDGNQWRLATDPQNVGREQKWFDAVRPEAQPANVPWIIQDTFPDYHGLAWCWREFKAPEPPLADGRWILRFWAVDYKADVWLNGKPVGAHEGGEGMFELDVTDAIHPNGGNLLAVRVLCPTDKPIDGIVLAETPHRNKVEHYSGGNSWDVGGIVDSVELIAAPVVRITDVWAKPDWKTGVIHAQATLRNAGPDSACRVQFSVAPAMSGETLVRSRVSRRALAGADTTVEADLTVPDFRLWQLNDPNLYRVTVRLETESPEKAKLGFTGGRPDDAFPTRAETDERSVRCGFRDFRFENGYFRLNGKRIYLRGSHDCDHTPIGVQVPRDPDFLRRDMMNAKVMGFNVIRTICAVFRRDQLDLCDELGLMVYEECNAGWLLRDSPHMAERFDRENREMIIRDRNHPCVTIWGLLNENLDNPTFRHAVKFLPTLRKLDDTRLVLLSSGNFDYQPEATDHWPDLEIWQNDPEQAQQDWAAHADATQSAAIPDVGLTPNVTRNPTDHDIAGLESHEWTVWKPGAIALHPGPKAEYAVLRWTCSGAATYRLKARFQALSFHSLTNVYVLHNNRLLHFGAVDVGADGGASAYEGRIDAKAGDTVDFVAGTGFVDDDSWTVGVTPEIWKTENSDPRDVPFQPNGEHGPNLLSAGWSCGYLAGLATPQAQTFKPFPAVAHVIRPAAKPLAEVGGMSNPGSTVWENVISDLHPYRSVPHTVGLVKTYRNLRTDKPLFVSESGVASAVDLVRVVQHYERVGKADADDAKYYRDERDKFLVDWKNWNMAAAFGRPEDFFLASQRKMADDRLFEMNAIRANPHIVGHSLTGTVDQGMTGEGLFTTWRELKPGAIDAVFDAWAPLRWCLFAEPTNLYAGSKVRLDAVLANEDQLAPGDYPADLQLFGPDNRLVWEKKTAVTIPEPAAGAKELPLAIPVSSDEVQLIGPPGIYRLTARFEHGAAPAGRDALLYVADRGALPKVSSPVAVWGDDEELTSWLRGRGISCHPFGVNQPQREVILCGYRPPEPAAERFAESAPHVARGSTAIFVCPETLAEGMDTGRWLPFAKKGIRKDIGAQLYHKEEWARPHPIFAGLPTGLMDYIFYRDIVSGRDWVLPETPDEVICAANNAMLEYSSGLLVFTKNFGAGRYIINGLRIRENLGQNPVADRLLLNMLNYAAEGRGKPPANLPADFDEQLRTIGYKKCDGGSIDR